MCAVKDVSFELRPGEVFGFLGPNGAGKTTTISMITGLEKITSGRALVFGRDVSQHPRRSKASMGVVPQELVSHGYFNLEEILRFHSGYYGHFRNRQQIEFLLMRLQLWEHRKKKVRQLSGGMRRRMMIAKALLHKPKLVLLDEPTAGVDVALRDTIWQLVEELKAQGVTTLLTTHYIDEAEKLCDRVGIIHKGELKALGPTKELIRDLTHRRVSFDFKQVVKPVQHPLLVAHTSKSMSFEIPSSMNLGELLYEMGLDISQVVDIHIQEGSLEDALRHVLREPT